MRLECEFAVAWPDGRLPHRDIIQTVTRHIVAKERAISGIGFVAGDTGTGNLREDYRGNTDVCADVHNVVLAARLPSELLELIAVIVHHLQDHVVYRCAVVGFDGKFAIAKRERDELLSDAASR